MEGAHVRGSGAAGENTRWKGPKAGGRRHAGARGVEQICVARSRLDGFASQGHCDVQKRFCIFVQVSLYFFSQTDTCFVSLPDRFSVVWVALTGVNRASQAI